METDPHLFWVKALSVKVLASIKKVPCAWDLFFGLGWVLPGFYSPLRRPRFPNPKSKLIDQLTLRALERGPRARHPQPI